MYKASYKTAALLDSFLFEELLDLEKFEPGCDFEAMKTSLLSKHVNMAAAIVKPEDADEFEHLLRRAGIPQDVSAGWKKFIAVEVGSYLEFSRALSCTLCSIAMVSPRSIRTLETTLAVSRKHSSELWRRGPDRCEADLANLTDLVYMWWCAWHSQHWQPISVADCSLHFSRSVVRAMEASQMPELVSYCKKQAALLRRALFDCAAERAMKHFRKRARTIERIRSSSAYLHHRAANRPRCCQTGINEPDPNDFTLSKKDWQTVVREWAGMLEFLYATEQ